MKVIGMSHKKRDLRLPDQKYSSISKFMPSENEPTNKDVSKLLLLEEFPKAY